MGYLSSSCCCFFINISISIYNYYLYFYYVGFLHNNTKMYVCMYAVNGCNVYVI